MKSEIWRSTWAWVHKIAHSYYHTHWPLPSEIGTQYILLLLAEMQKSCLLRLPYRVREVLPPDMIALLPLLNGLPTAVSDAKVARVRRKQERAKSITQSPQQELLGERSP